MKSVRIISPAGALDAALIHAAAARLRAAGLDVEVGRHACDRYGRFAGTASDRMSDAVDALTDPHVGIVLCSRGGYGLQQIVDGIDRGVRARGYNGAVVCGFSDVTELHQLLACLGGTSVHGVMCKPIATLGDDAEQIGALLRIWEGEPMTYTVSPNGLNREGEARGVLRGGNMAVLCGLSGTPYSMEHIIRQDAEQGRDVLLFLEDVGEPHYKIDRMLHQMRLSGVLEAVKGVIVGQFADCDDDSEMGCTLLESVRAVVDGYDYPVLFDFPAGHVEYNMPLVFGAMSTLRVTKKAGYVACSALPQGLEPWTP